MKVLEIILPVLVMILLGMACKRLKLLDQNGDPDHASCSNFPCPCYVRI